MREEVIDAKVWGFITEAANKIAGSPESHPEEEQLQLANQLRSSASAISTGLDIIKTRVSQEKREFTRGTEMVENSLLEVINNLKIALIRGYINNNDYYEACNLMERLHHELLAFKNDGPGANGL